MRLGWIARSSQTIPPWAILDFLSGFLNAHGSAQRGAMPRRAECVARRRDAGYKICTRQCAPQHPVRAALEVHPVPSASPILVTGVMLVILFGPQEALGAWLKERFDLSIIFAPPGIILALLFLTMPFVVRSVQPVLMELDRAQEHAATTLGAGGWMIFRRIILPPLTLPILTGALLCFARAIGEFGSIVIVAGNIPFQSQTAAVYVFGEVESENRLGASAVSMVMIAVALTMLLLANYLRLRSNRESA
ncbi:MAG TPA: ABC transporter permease subunit [Anaerolineales bacterium]|nr:ABC transporter permease subunit [Anaerolineales bacterium]